MGERCMVVGRLVAAIAVVVFVALHVVAILVAYIFQAPESVIKGSEFSEDDYFFIISSATYRKTIRAKNAAICYSLIASAKLNGLNPFHYLYTILKRLPTHPINRIHELLPCHFLPEQLDTTPPAKFDMN
jgi:hypothetical protein